MDTQKKIITITEIARLAGVSIGTVDRVIHGRAGVSAKTRETIQALIKEHGYEPNAYARNLKLNRNYNIGVLLPRFDTEFQYWEMVYQGVAQAAKELGVLSVSVVTKQFDRLIKGDMAAKAEELYEMGIDGLLLAPLPANEAENLLLEHQDVPYAFIDSPLPGMNPIATIAQDSHQSGYLAGRLVSALCKGEPGTVASVQLYPDAVNGKQRAAGFKRYFDDHPDMTLQEIMLGSLQDTDAMLDELFKQHSDLRGVFTVNNIINCFGNSLVKSGRKRGVVTIGYDLVKENREGLLAGSIDCLLSQRPAYQGHTAIYQIYRKVVLGQEPEQSIAIPIDIYFKENLTDSVD
jgi:LacI family transcriptional regulator